MKFKLLASPQWSTDPGISLLPERHNLIHNLPTFLALTRNGNIVIVHLACVHRRRFVSRAPTRLAFWPIQEKLGKSFRHHRGWIWSFPGIALNYVIDDQVAVPTRLRYLRDSITWSPGFADYRYDDVLMFGVDKWLYRLPVHCEEWSWFLQWCDTFIFCSEKKVSPA